MNLILNPEIESSQQKTIAFFCNDCYAMHCYTMNPNIVVYTLFGTIENTISSIEYDFFRRCVEVEGIRQFLFVGHTRCKILPFILENEGITNPRWLEAKTFLKSCASRIHETTDQIPSRQLLRYHISKQVKNFIQSPVVRNSRVRDLSIKGIIIDDKKNLEVEQVDLSILNGLI
jgi:carbonic anhydrase